MPLLPALPPVDGLHPLVVHLPVALAAVSPVFLLFAFVSSRRDTWARAAAVLLLIAAAGAVAATVTGEAAEDAAERVAGAAATLDLHEDRAELVEIWFGGLAVAYAAFLFLARGAPIRWWRIGQGIALAAALVGALLVARTAHEGGRLVHQFGVHAPLADAAASGTALPARGAHHDDDVDD